MLPSAARSTKKGGIATAEPTGIDQDAVFKALSDPSRRRLLDLLRERDGRSVADLSARFPVSRQAVMRHLRVLEAAGLVVTEKVGRIRRHYLNPVPIQFVYDRWVDRYTRPLARHLTRLKYHLEETMTTPAKIDRRVLEIYIATTPEKLWNALLDPDATERYYFGTRFEGEATAGSAYAYRDGDRTLIDGTIVEAVPHERLVMTFRPLFNLEEDGDAADLNTSRVTYTITREGDVCRLRLVHDEMDERDTADGYAEGWARILSGLKTWLETGRPLVEA